jgi:hypothetical protein
MAALLRRSFDSGGAGSLLRERNSPGCSLVDAINLTYKGKDHISLKSTTGPDSLDFHFLCLARVLIAQPTMADVVPQEWPNQRLKILIPTWVLMIISTMFVVWRVVYGLMNSRRFMLSDYLLIIATVSNHLTRLALGSDRTGTQHHRNIDEPCSG